MRYEFLLEVAQRHRASRVAVGHHADDQVETVLFRLFRGCHLRGAAGMRPMRPLGDGVMLVRPLLGVGRSDVEAYGHRANLTWCHDASNADPAFRRNVIRHELLPLLRRAHPNVDQAVLDLAAAAAEAEDFLQQLGEGALDRARTDAADAPPTAEVLDLATLGAEPPLVRRYALRSTLERAGVPMGPVTAGHLAELAAMVAPGGPCALDLPGGWSACREDGRLIIAPGHRNTVPAGQESWAPVTLACPGQTTLPDGRAVLCDVEPLDRGAFQEHCRSGRHDVEWLDADAIQGLLHCRPRQQGDVLHPLGSRGRRKVGRLLTDLKLPETVRRSVLCVADDAGLVACLPVRLDQRVRITDATRNVLRIGVLDAGSTEK